MFPPNGLIISCYLEGLKGAEKEFISSVIHHPRVVAIRVEGIENIHYARLVGGKDKFIIGLVKRWDGRRYCITPSMSDVSEIYNAGANAIATNNVDLYFGYVTAGEYCINSSYCWMLDLDLAKWETLKFYKKKVLLDAGIREQIVIIATTMEINAKNSLALVKTIRQQYGELAIINYEGGVNNPQEMQNAFNAGANYVTIGKAFNDPATIINNWFSAKEVYNGDYIKSK